MGRHTVCIRPPRTRTKMIIPQTAALVKSFFSHFSPTRNKRLPEEASPNESAKRLKTVRHTQSMPEKTEKRTYDVKFSQNILSNAV